MPFTVPRRAVLCRSTGNVFEVTGLGQVHRCCAEEITNAKERRSQQIFAVSIKRKELWRKEYARSKQDSLFWKETGENGYFSNWYRR